MKFNHILETLSCGDIIRPSLWKTETIFEYLIVISKSDQPIKFLLKHKDGYWQDKYDSKYFEKFDDWKILS